MFRDLTRYGKDPNKPWRSSAATFRAPLTWAKNGKVRSGGRIFTCSYSDWFIEEADTWRDEAWAVIKATPQFTYLILTKRPERIEEHLPKDWGKGYANVWLGVSAERQKEANERIPFLMMTPAAIRWVSAEPLLGGIDFERIVLPVEQKDEWGRIALNPATETDVMNGTVYTKSGIEYGGAPKVNWIVTGGESDFKNPRPTNLEWVRSIREQCQKADIPFFHKQHGGSKKIDGTWGGRELDGEIIHEFPLASPKENK